VRTVGKVGGALPSIERIAALRPDLVIGSTTGSHPALAGALQGLDLPLFLVRTDRVADVPRVMKLLGELLELDGADAAAARFEAELAAQRRVRSPVPGVLYMVWPDPLYVAGQGTHADDIVRLAGGRTPLPARIEGWPQLSLEPLVASSPDVILHPGNAVSSEHLARLFARDPRWRSVDAVAAGRVFPVDEDLFSRQGPRLPLAAAELNAILDRMEAGR
jgi:iron complex transport system substrate-binding protein